MRLLYRERNLTPDAWLDAATRGLAAEAKAEVRAEILAHYESAREAALEAGLPPEEAEARAVTSCCWFILLNRACIS